MKELFVAFFALLLLSPNLARGLSPCQPGDLLLEPPDDVKAVSSFLAVLQTAVAKGDSKRVAAMMSYPLSFGDERGNMQVRSKAEFIRLFQRIFTPEMKSLLARQEPACLGRVGSKGFTLGSGQIWFDFYPGGAIRIFTITSVVYPDDLR